jgi:hypothetical protein
MLLPVDFHFTQNNLQDYVDCPRRFQLKYIDIAAWPALESEPVLEVEKQLEMGSRFHKLIHQYLSGVDPSILIEHSSDVELRIWFNNFLSQKSISIPTIRFPEYTLAAPFNGYRLLAKYDLIAFDADLGAMILDWKTSRKIPRWSWLQQRVQTRLYPFLLAFSGSSIIHDFKVSPEHLSMSYWFTDFPDQPFTFKYDEMTFQKDRSFLESLTSEIISIDSREFRKTDDTLICRYCIYRSLCERGERAGYLDELEDFLDGSDALSDFSFSDIEEIPF